MIGILVTGHGSFATGIVSALEVILGKQDNLVTVDFPDGDTKTELEKNMQEGFLKLNACEKIAVFCDLLSGSPFNTAIPYGIRNENIKVLFGTNLAMLIEFTLNRNMGGSFDALILLQQAFLLLEILKRRMTIFRNGLREIADVGVILKGGSV